MNPPSRSAPAEAPVKTGQPKHPASFATDPDIHPSGLPVHRRLTDLDPVAARRAERQVAALFALSALGTVIFLVGYVAFPLGQGTKDPASLVWSNRLLGGGLALALFCLGAGAIHWARKLMPVEELVEERHPLHSSAEQRAGLVEQFTAAGESTGFTRRKLIKRALLPAAGLLALPPLVMLRDLGPLPGSVLRETLWAAGVRVLSDVTNQPLRPEDIPIGGMVPAIPANLKDVPTENGAQLNARAKAALLLVRMEPRQIVSQQGAGWDYQGILAFSKICTHVGCPLGLYEQQTHKMMCPCHQSTFNLADSAKVVFGPARRHLPQLPLAVDAEGYLVAAAGFAEPVGPSFWERG